MSLQAITEKRQSPGGCTGILFHLFDWKRRLAKKNLLSSAREADRAANKLLNRSTSNTKPPVSNKLLLIANENSGGFPGSHKPEPELLCPSSKDDGMRAAGLVARLMGLDSMPAVNKIKPKKLDSSNIDVPDRQGHRRPDSRPPKLQKTGGSMESVTARFSPDALSKSGMLRDKRQRHHKLPSPVKSPRSSSRASPARLMHAAATKILDSSRATFALTYVESLQDNVGTFDAGSSLKCAREVPMTDFHAGSWRSYGGLDTREASVTCSEHSGSDYSNATSVSSSRDCSIDRKIKIPTILSGRVRNTESFAKQEKYNVRSRVCDSSERKPWQNANSRHVTLVRDREAHVMRACSRKQSGEERNELNAAKHFITPSRNPKECSPTRSATKVPNNLRAETVRNGVETNFDRKRRPTSGPQIENVVQPNAAFRKEAFVEAGLIRRKEAGFINNRLNNHHGSGRQFAKNAEGGSSSGCKDNGLVSVTFRPPVKHGSTSLTPQETKEFKAHGKHSRDYCSKLKSDTTVERVTLRGRALSNLLQQKIEQLTSLDEENLETVKRLPEKSTATILVELISALTTEAPAPLEKGNSCSGQSILSEKSFCDGDDQSVSTISQNQMLIVNEKHEDVAKAGNTASFLVGDSDWCSPASILEASFSNDSCSMGSPCSSGSGANPHLCSTEAFGKRYTSDSETNLVDSETATNRGEIDIRMIPHSDDKEAGINHCCLRNVGISEAKLNHVSEIISNVQVLFESTSLQESEGTLGSSVDTFLLSILESNIDAFRTDPKCSSGKEENQLRDLIFDCMIEFFESKCNFFYLSGYKAWLKLHAFLSRIQLLREVKEEIRGWGDSSGRDLDELLVNEIWFSTSKWTQFEIEGFEMGIKIENELLDLLVDETVTDICSC